MGTRSISIWLSTLLWIPSQAADFDGSWWIDKTDSFKVSFVVGFVQGLDYMKTIGTFTYCNKDNALEKTPEAFIKCLESGQERVEREVFGRFRNVRYGQMKDGLDTLYGDYRNRKISIQGGMTHVTKAIAGESASELEKGLELMRANAK